VAKASKESEGAIRGREMPDVILQGGERGGINGASDGKRKPLKSALRKRPQKNAAQKLWEEEQRTLVEAQVLVKQARERKVYEICETLCAVGGVDIEQLEEATAWLSKQDYKEVVKERSLRNLCGYPLCQNNASGGSANGVGESSRVRLLLYEHKQQKKGQQGKGRKFYCSDGCHRACGIFSSNLLDYRPINDVPGPAAEEGSFHIPTLSAPLPPSAARAAAANADTATVASGLSGSACGRLGFVASQHGQRAEDGVGRAAAHAVKVEGIWRTGGTLFEASDIIEKKPLPPSMQFSGDRAGYTSIEGHKVGAGQHRPSGKRDSGSCEHVNRGKGEGVCSGAKAHAVFGEELRRPPARAREAAPDPEDEDGEGCGRGKEGEEGEGEEAEWGEEEVDVQEAMEAMSLEGSIYFRLNLHLHHLASGGVRQYPGLSRRV
jgi:hypothetical protein